MSRFFLIYKKVKGVVVVHLEVVIIKVESDVKGDIR